MKTKTILKYIEQGKEYRIIKVYGDNNPYRIYNYYNDYNEYGYITEHRKLLAKYGDMISCFYWFIQNNIGKW